MSWGALSGLGQGLSQVSGMISDYNKDKVKQQLELEREKRADEREKAKWDRQQGAYKETQQRQLADGNWYNVRINQAGEVIDQAPVSSQELKDITRRDRKEDLTVESLEVGIEGNRSLIEGRGLENQLKGFQVRDYDSDRAREIEYDRARIAATNRSNRPENRRGGAEGSATNVSQAASALTTNYKDLVASYTSGDKPKLSREEVESIAEEAVRAAVLQRKDAGTIFRDELARRARPVKRDSDGRVESLESNFNWR